MGRSVTCYQRLFSRLSINFDRNYFSSLVRKQIDQSKADDTLSGHSSAQPKINISFSPTCKVSRQITPTRRAKPEKLIPALEPLLSSSENDHKVSSNHRFDSLKWILDKFGDAIHRHVSVIALQDAINLKHKLMIEADKANHHPHVLILPDIRGRNRWCMTITCTTHDPAGLSMRDVKLAKKIDQIISDMKFAAVSDVLLENPTTRWIRLQRNWMVNANRVNIDMVKRDSR